MSLLPLEIKSKEFQRAFRGCDPREVGAFLEQVADEMGHILSEKAALKSELEAVKDNLAKYHELEDAIKETLLLAQRTKEEVVETAKKQAELIVEEAHRQGHKVEDRFTAVKAAKRQFEIEFETLIETFRNRLKEMQAPRGGDGSEAD
jgi:cell division initiation protein